MGRYLWPGVLEWPEGIVLEPSNSAPLQLGHRHKRTRVSAAISLCLPFAPRYEEWQRSASAKDTPFFGERHESVPGDEIDRWLAGPREGQRPSVGTGGIRENAGPLELCKACFRMWSGLCRRAEGIRDSRGGERPALLMGTPE
jgi:hypothetical protein